MGSQTLDKVTMFLAELLGTAMLIFLGCMGCLSWNGQPPSALQSSFTFGMVVMLIIQTFGCISGAHLNPVVTLAAIVYDMISIQVSYFEDTKYIKRISGIFRSIYEEMFKHFYIYHSNRFKLQIDFQSISIFLCVKMACIYFVAQMLGAVMGYGLLMVMTPVDVFTPGLCVTAPHPGLSPLQAVAMEYISTTVLILICGGVWDPRNAKHQDSIPVKFGLAITAIGVIIGPFTGASMNPARSFGPAVWNNDFHMHWVRHFRLGVD